MSTPDVFDAAGAVEKTKYEVSASPDATHDTSLMTWFVPAQDAEVPSKYQGFGVEVADVPHDNIGGPVLPYHPCALLCRWLFQPAI